MSKEEKLTVYEELDVDYDTTNKKSDNLSIYKAAIFKVFIILGFLTLIGTLAFIAFNEVNSDNVNLDSQKGTGFIMKLINDDGAKYEEYDQEVFDGKLKTYLKSRTVRPINIIDLKENPKYEPALQVTFDLADSGLEYNVGDTIGIIPKNSQEKVERFAQRMGYNLNQIITYDISGKLDKNLKLPYPNGFTVRKVLTEIINLNCLISDKILANLEKYISDPKEKEIIKNELANEESIKAYKDKRYNLLDVMDVFKSFKIPFEALHEIMPYIKPRLYTVASSPNAWNNQFNIAITLVSWQNYQNKEVFGLNSGYLKHMRETGELQDTRIIINKGSFKLPEDPKIPIMMICTGSGIAPFIAFLEELKYRAKGPYQSWLIFGSKTRKSDFLYEKDLMQYKENGILTDVITAFSRDQSYKIYVQDRLKEHFESKLTDLLMNQGMRIYVCGAGSMGNRIKKVIKDAIGDENYEKVMENKQFIGEFWENK